MRRPKNPSITHAEACRRFSYDRATGVITWRVQINGRAPAGSRAGALRGDGYIIVGINGGLCLAHRLAWFLVKGVWPKDGLDHKDGDCTNNRWRNLREATQSQNMMNGAMRRNNKSGAVGVSFGQRDGVWRAAINYGGKMYVLGTYPTKAMATAARRKAEKKHHGRFARSRSRGG